MDVFKPSKYNIVLSQNNIHYVFNTYSGGLCSLDETSYQDLLNVNINSPFFKDMVEQGYIVPKETNEYSRLLHRRFQYVYNDFPEKVQYVIAPTLNCPLKCDYCFEKHSNTCRMTQEVADKVVNFIINSVLKNARCRQMNITWFGGEPLLESDMIQTIGLKLIDFCNTHNIKYSAKMITSGVLFNSEVFDSLISQKIITNIQFTLDGDLQLFMQTKHGTEAMYQNLLDAIVFASAHIQTYIRLNVTDKNQEKLLETLKKVLSKISDKSKIIVYAAPVLNYEAMDLQNNNDFSTFLQKLQHLTNIYNLYNFELERKTKPLLAWCGGMCFNNFVFGPQGEIYKCENLIGKQQYVIGNVDAGLFYNDAMYQISLSEPDDKCKDCAFLPVCWEGCPAHKHIFHKQFDCDGFKQSFLNRLQYQILQKGEEKHEDFDQC